MSRFRLAVTITLIAWLGASGAPVMAMTATSLAQLRALSSGLNNTTITLAAGEYWIDGDHIANPTGTEPIFLSLGGTGNTYDLSAATLRLDTRKLGGYGRALGHDSGVEVVKITGSNNIVQGLTLIGEDVDLDTDPGAQRYADWATVFVEVNGISNTVDDVHVVTRGSRTDSYGLGDAFGKGASVGIQPFLAHRKASAFRVGDATNTVVNDMHLEVNTFGHGFFVQTSTDTTLTNSTVTGELFPSQGVIDHPLYQQYGHTYHGNEIPDDILISGAEGGVRMYTGSSGLTVDNVVVTNMRAGFSTTLGSGTITLNNVEAYGTESAFGIKSNTTVTNAKGDAINGPLIVMDKNNSANTSIDVELVGNQPFMHDNAVAYVSGNNVDVTITSDRPADDFKDVTLFRSAQFYYENWREDNNFPNHDVAGYDHINSILVNNTNQLLILGEQATGNTGSSQAPVITNGKGNFYDGLTLVPAGMRTLLVHTAGLGNNGAAGDGSLETNASIVEDGGTLELNPGIQINDEKLTISGNGLDGLGALYSDGSINNGTRFGSSSSGDESTIVLAGDASIGVGIAGNQLLVGQIQGTGNLTKLGAGKLSIEKSSTLAGALNVAGGEVIARSGVVNDGLTVAAGASIGGIGGNSFNTFGNTLVNGTLDLNARTDNNALSGTIGPLSGSGLIVASNDAATAASELTMNLASQDALFSGQIQDNINLVKTGSGSQIFSGNNTYAGMTTINDGLLLVEGPHTGGGAYAVNGGGTLGGNGSIDADITVGANGTIAPGASAGQLAVEQIVFETGSVLEIEIGGLLAGTEYDLLMADSATLAGDLAISLLDSDGSWFAPAADDTFMALVANSLTGAFDNVVTGERIDTTGGEGSFLVTYDSASDVVLLSEFALTTTAGDFDTDGDVDGADFLTWQRDGLFASDLSDWQINYGSANSLQAATGPVPAPSSGVLLALAVAIASGKASSMHRNRRRTGA